MRLTTFLIGRWFLMGSLVAHVGCQTLTFAETGGSGGSTNADGGSSLGGSSGTAPPVDDPGVQRAEESAEEIEPLFNSDACVQAAEVDHTVVVKGAVLPAGGFASAQFVMASLKRGLWPDPTVLRTDDFEAYYGGMLPIADGSLGLQGRVVSVGSQRWRLDATIRAAHLPDMSKRSSVHMVVVADVSTSTEGATDVRNGILDALGRAIDLAGDDAMSLISYGDPATTVFEAVPSGQVSTAIADALPSLTPQAGNNLLDAIELASTLAEPPGLTHILVLTDGGTEWDARLSSTVEKAFGKGTLISIAQLGPSDSTFAAAALNDALLDGLSAKGRGVRLYLDGSSDIGVIESRYNELFALATTQGAVRLRLPRGLDVVRTTGTGGEPTMGSGSPIGFIRPFRMSLEIESPVCTAPLLSGRYDAEVLLPGDDLYGSGSVFLTEFSEVTTDADALSLALEAVVKGIRTRDVDDLEAAFKTVTLLSPMGLQPGSCDGVVADCTTDVMLCCVRSELISLLNDTCSVSTEMNYCPAP